MAVDRAPGGDLHIPRRGQRHFALTDNFKRLTDAVVAAAGLVVLSLPLLAVAGLVRSRLGRPVLFVQERPGVGGRPFRIYKFRTMLDLRDEGGVPLPDAERLCRFGRFLRVTSLDELPELFNVLRGDMSLVGPRPLLMEYLTLYTPAQRRRLEIRPGLTGWAQVNGRNAVTWEEKFAMDVWYVDNRSMRLDVRILALTVLRVLQGQGVTQPGEATTQYFIGSAPEARLEVEE